MLVYTLNRLMTLRAVVSRDVSVADPYGADQAAEYVPLATVPCALWWQKSSSSRPVQREYASASRDVPVALGSLMVPADTDISERDRVEDVLQWDAVSASWMAVVSGPLQITAVLFQGNHIEVSFFRQQLGT